MWGVTDRAHALIEALLQGEPQAVKQMAMTLRSMADLCIYIPGRDVFHSAELYGTDIPVHEGEEPRSDGESSEQRTARIAAERAKSRSSSSTDSPPSQHGKDGDRGKKDSAHTMSCGDAEVEATLQQRDPQGAGLPSAIGRDLLRRLLAWSPHDRITAHEALRHPFFGDENTQT